MKSTKIPPVVLLLFTFSISLHLPICQAVCRSFVSNTLADGWQPIYGPMENQIFSIDHHTNVIIRCSDFNKGGACLGFPIIPDYTNYTVFGTKTANTFLGPQFYCMDSTNPDCYKLYYPMAVTELNGAALVLKWGISCFNVQTKTLCPGEEFVRLGPNIRNTYYYVTQTVNSGLFNLVRVGEKFFSFTGEMQMMCYDLSTKAICPGYPKDFADSTLPPPITSFGYPSAIVTRQVTFKGSLRLYAMLAYGNLDDQLNLNDGRIFCYDITNEMRCAEWTQNGHVIPSSIATVTIVYDLYFDQNSAGDIVGVCFCSNQGATNRGCLNINNPTQAHVPVAYPSTMFHQETVGSKMYFGNYPASGIQCMDFKTHTTCPGFPITPYASADYGPTLDPNGECLFSLGHLGVLYSFGQDGSVPCTTTKNPLLVRDDIVLGIVGEQTKVNIVVNDKNEDVRSLSLLMGVGGNILSNGDFTFTPTAIGTNYFQYQACGLGYAAQSAIGTITVVTPTAKCVDIK